MSNNAATVHGEELSARLYDQAKHRECSYVYTFGCTYKPGRLHVGQEKLAAIAMHVLGLPAVSPT